MTAAAGIADQEVALVAACCRWPRDAAAVAETARLVIAGVDGQRLLRIIRRHRVEPLAYEALLPCADRLDAKVVETLRIEAEVVRRRSLALAAESLRLHRLLANAGVGHLFVKGEGLAQVAYGRLGLKAARDIDVLHSPDDFDSVVSCMASAGYEQIEPSRRLTPHDLRLWLKLHKDSVWRHRGTGLAAELHFRLTLSPTLLAGITSASPAESVELARGQSLPLLNLTDHSVYLCVHGALSGWARLKWLADLNALLNAPGAPDITGLHAAAEAQGVGGTSRLALMLMQRLFGRPVLQDWSRDRPVALAADRIIAAIVSGHPDREPELSTVAELRQQSAVASLTSLPNERWTLLPVALVSFKDRASLRLPRLLSPLYWIIRVPSVLGRNLLTRRS